MPPFLTEFHVQGYACLRDVKCALTPLHAFIGPNDSGKSTLLRAIQGLSGYAYSNTVRVIAQFGDGSIVRVPHHPPDMPGVVVPIAIDGDANCVARKLQKGASLPLVRLSTDELRQQSELIQFGSGLVLEDRGRNIAGLYDALRDRDNDGFTAISNRVTKLFPTVRTLRLRAVSRTHKQLGITLVDGTDVAAEQMSEGLLYYLAFAILAEIERPLAYLVEEPENGLHPSRIADVVRMLRAIAEDPVRPVQVIMATHSPLVVNELQPDEVTVVTRDPEKGTQLHPMRQTPHFEERSKVYALGELWLSYADGKEEAPLLVADAR